MLSAIVLTKNEEKNIERCLKSLSFCEEVIVIDDQSSDKTVVLAKKYKAVVINRSIQNDFAAQRNFAMKQSLADWLLFVDADEEVTKELKSEIIETIKDTTFDAFYIRRRDFFWEKEIKWGETKKVRDRGLIRLVRRNHGKWIGEVHEEFRTDGKVGRLESFLNHYPHPTLKEFIQSVNFYSTIRAQELYKNKQRFSLFQATMFPVGKFIWNYIFKLGFLDGPEGFIYAFMMSFHSFLVRAKLYQYYFEKSA